MTPGRRMSASVWDDTTSLTIHEHELRELSPAWPGEGGCGSESGPPAKNDRPLVERCDRRPEARRREVVAGVGEDGGHSRGTKTLTDKIGSYASSEVQQIVTAGRLAGHSRFWSETGEPN